VLFADRLARALAGTRIGLGTLTTQRKTTTMTQTTVATQIHETLDIKRDITAKVALYGILADLGTQGV